MIPANSSVQVGYSDTGASITLTGVTQTLYPAQSVPVTFTFASGATITATLPVKLSASPSAAPTINVSPSSEG
jgi:copper(I)-binding protein